jgi:hypothetical protein
MNSKIASTSRRQVLVAGLGALGLPLVSCAPITSNRAERSLPVGQRLILSGRLTDARGVAVAKATVALNRSDQTTLSDADGRFMMITTVPATQDLELMVTSESGQIVHQSLALFGFTHPGVTDERVAANTQYEGDRVWRSSVALSMAA